MLLIIYYLFFFFKKKKNRFQAQHPEMDVSFYFINNFIKF